MARMPTFGGREAKSAMASGPGRRKKRRRRCTAAPPPAHAGCAAGASRPVGRASREGCARGPRLGCVCCRGGARPRESFLRVGHGKGFFRDEGIGGCRARALPAMSCAGGVGGICLFRLHPLAEGCIFSRPARASGGSGGGGARKMRPAPRARGEAPNAGARVRKGQDGARFTHRAQRRSGGERGGRGCAAERTALCRPLRLAACALRPGPCAPLHAFVCA